MTDERSTAGAGPVAPDAPRGEGACHGKKTSVARGLEEVCRFAEGHAERDGTSCEMVPATLRQRRNYLEPEWDGEWASILLDDALAEIECLAAALAAGSPSAPPADWDQRTEIAGVEITTRRVAEMSAADAWSLHSAAIDAVRAAAASPSPTPPDDGASAWEVGWMAAAEAYATRLGLYCADATCGGEWFALHPDGHWFFPATVGGGEHGHDPKMPDAPTAALREWIA